MSAERRKPVSPAHSRKQQPSILMVRWGEESQKLAQSLTRKGYPVHLAARTSEALDWLRRHSVDFIVVGTQGGGRTGIKFLQAVSDIVPGIQKIVLTGTHSTQAVLALNNQARADCILTDPVTSRRLHHAIHGLWTRHLANLAWLAQTDFATQQLDELGKVNVLLGAQGKERTRQLMLANEKLTKALREIEQKNKALTLLNESLRIQSTTDHLTGLFNRREFMVRMRVEWGRYRRYHRPLSLIMLDIDRFKRINDTYGHDCGDTVLQTLSSLIRRHQRSHDITCRYGGEEFLVLMPETTMASAFHVAEGLRKLVGSHMFRCKTHHIIVNISLGVSGIIEHDPPDVDAFIKLADQGMYRAKREGRNRTAIIDAKNPKQTLRISP